MAASQRLQGVRAQLRKLTNVNGWTLLQEAMKGAPKVLRDAFFENRDANLLWWEDAAAQAYLLVKLGFVAPDKTVYHLLVDEAQDYTETELALLHAYFPNARVTLLGDPMRAPARGFRPASRKTGANASARRARRCLSSRAAIAPRCRSRGCATRCCRAATGSIPSGARARCRWSRSIPRRA